MSSLLTQDDLDLLDRLNNFYNIQSYNASSNPGGLDNDGHRENLIPLLADVSAVGTLVANLTGQADGFAINAQTSASSAATAATGAANAQTAAMMAQGGAELAKQQTEDIAAAAQQTIDDAAALAGSGDFTGDVSVDGDVIIEGGLVEEITFITGADTIGTAHSYMIYGNTQCTMSDDTVIGREWQIAGRWPDTVEPSEQAVTIVAAGADSFVAQQDGKRLIDTDFILESDGANTIRRVRANLLVVQ
ncbi:MAG: hypothetical protein AAF556_07950 [Pseudomonadota bacterium]